MKPQSVLGFVFLCLGLAGSCLGQKVVVIHAAQLFDGKSDRLASNQVIVIEGDRITDVGPAGTVKIPAGAQEIDLGTGTVLPGLIEGHNHMFKVADHGGADTDTSVPAVPIPGTAFSLPYATILASVNARLDLLSGFTTARDLTTGSTADVDLRNAINEGLIPGPRMQIAQRRACVDRSPDPVTSIWWTRPGKDASKYAYSLRTEPILSRSSWPAFAPTRILAMALRP